MKVVQGHSLLVHQRTRDPLAIAGFLFLFLNDLATTTDNFSLGCFIFSHTSFFNAYINDLISHRLIEIRNLIRFVASSDNDIVVMAVRDVGNF